MHKSIELGRAVLSTSTINFELWLKTSIKISPQQPCTNFEQHNAISLLNLLSSGEAWVGRGNGLYIDLDLTLRGQPLADEQVQQLSQAILDAPVWSQLCLHSSIPHCTMREPGKLRITVNHSSDHTVSSVKQRHRILPNVSAADVRPPEGVPVFFLDSVLLSIDVFEIVQQKKATTAKRLKTLTNINSLLQPAKSQGSEDIEREGWGALSLDVEDTIPLPASSPTTKRSRSSASSPTRTASFAGRASWNCPFIASTSDLQKRTPNSRSNISIAGLQTLVDGALRLSVMGSINSKLVPGIKVKTSRFGPGLAEIAPALWKSGYLLVRIGSSLYTTGHASGHAYCATVSLAKSESTPGYRSISLSPSHDWKDSFEKPEGEIVSFDGPLAISSSCRSSNGS
ncbi:hypothetical protein ST47_g9590 [Ascochyta rabiei]|uniref:Uncharacterized protein n=1 Tax=Didymella rabiei TaxID=5454 RepID=A0A162WV42_DIDRA|nr:hypothetical protein ST47_g9590 [Ascochyta rabiei]